MSHHHHNPTAIPLSHPFPDIIDYKVKLLGLLPDGYTYPKGPKRWDLSTACFIKIPSEMTCYDGKMDTKGHPTIIGSGILERKYGLTVHLPTLQEMEKLAQRGTGGAKVDEEERDHDHVDVILEEEEEDDSGEESGSESSDTKPTFICQGCQHNVKQHEKDNLMTKWLKNNFDPRRDVLPDIVCRRTVLTYIMTQKQPFILNAKKISFISSQDPERREYQVIHVEFDYLPTLDFEPHPPHSGERGRGPSKTPEGLPTSEKNFDAENYYEKPTLIGYFQGKLSCKVPTMPPENRSIRILLSAIVDGLWRYKNDPELYTARDLAEVKSTMDTTVQSSEPRKGGNPHFFKVRLAHAWAQCHLVGINRMMVGVHTLLPGNFLDETEMAYALTSRPQRILQELWLYDVEKMPKAVMLSGDEEGFRAWTPSDLKWKLYTALQQIRAQVQNSQVGVTHRFLHYFNEDFIIPITLEELQTEWKLIHEAYRTLVFRNVHLIPTSPDVIELSMEEVEQEHAEKQVDHILNTFLGLGIPIETVKVVRIVGSRKDLEVIFPYEGLARRVYTTFRLFCYKNRFLPRGFERIRVDVKKTKRQELERMRRRSTSMFYIIKNPGGDKSCQECQDQRHGHGHGHRSYTHHYGGHSAASYYQHQRGYQSPFPTTGRQHQHHYATHYGQRTVGGMTMTSASMTNVPSMVYTQGGGGGTSSSRHREEDMWRYTQTMWR